MLCCIGGVCVPYTAVLPLIALIIRWVLQQLVKFGLLPKALEQKLGQVLAVKGWDPASSCCSSSNGDAASATKREKRTKRQLTSYSTAETVSSSADAETTAVLREIESEEEWDELVESAGSTVICKFTASWCRPCKAIHPVFEEVATATLMLTSASAKMKFAVVDVDTAVGGDLMSRYGVAVLPTFVAIRCERNDTEAAAAIDSYAGSDEATLRQFVEKIAVA